MNSSPDNTHSPSRLSTILAALIVLLIFLIPAAGFWWLRTMSQAVVEQNLLSHSRDTLIRHFARTGGRWPQSWDDLAEDFDPADAGYGTPSLDILKEYIEIDFDVDLSSLLTASPNSPERVFWLRGRSFSPEVDDANVRLLDFLRSHHTAAERRTEAESGSTP